MKASNSPARSRCARAMPRWRVCCFCLSLSMVAVGCDTSRSVDQRAADGSASETMLGDSAPGNLGSDSSSADSIGDAAPRDSAVSADGAPDLQTELSLIDDRLELEVEVCTSPPESEAPFGLTSFIVSNPHAIPDVNRLRVDTDGDGVADETEIEEGMASEDPDTDDDGHGDLLELRRRSEGFDPTDPNKPETLCPPAEHVDRDGDGLNSCDERIVGTDATLADTDRDRIPDGVEHWFGSDPTRNDANQDPDFDEWLTKEEIGQHSNPVVADRGLAPDLLQRYTALGPEDRADRSRCYRFKVDQVRLVATGARAGLGTVGYNEVIVLFGEAPADDPRAFGAFKAACVRARYVPVVCDIGGEQRSCGFKDPADGKVVVAPEDFLPLAELARRREEAQFDPSADPCVGALPP